MDKTIRCIQCNSEFLFTEREQKYYQDRGFSIPKRCPNCRKERKLNRETAQQARRTKKFEYGDEY